ncbi:hypothetical protein [Bradyrhizobium sp. CCBAU 11386]|uniref:hypothetical protein n=1 Tax=Bradyrhizobium sp. CCBAU 11386 TaxID=1630837 RepID=UPI00230398F0|nr:hypothetical protein [Bradyrhizobium sp. CCBAU 11386]
MRAIRGKHLSAFSPNIRKSIILIFRRFSEERPGFFAYDLNRRLERLPVPEIPDWHLPLSILHFYDVVLSYDHRDQRCWIVSTGWPEQEPAGQKEGARCRADEFAALLMNSNPLPNVCPVRVDARKSHFSRDAMSLQ